MLTKNGKRIENENGELVAVLTNTQRKADRVIERHGIPAFVGLDLTAEEVEARLAPDGAPASDASPPDGKMVADAVGQEPDRGPDSLDGKSRAELDEIAAGLEIDLDQINGTGKNGNVIAGDVRAAIEEASNADAPDEPAVSDPEDIAGNDD